MELPGSVEPGLPWAGGLAALGAQVLDVRDPVDYAAAHIAGSINVGLDGAFAQWAGALLEFGRPVLLIAYPGREQDTVTRLARVGLDDVPGFLDGGMLALERHPDLVVRTERITAPFLAEQLADDDPPLVLDVRAKLEWDESHIDGSLNIPLQELAERTGELPRNRPLSVHCLSGYRSSIAASVLERAGLSHFTELVGGISAWQASGLPVTS